MASILDDRASGSQEVPADTHTTDENVKISQLSKEERLLEFFSRRFRESAVGFEVILRDGSKHSIGAGSPRFKIKITHPKGIRALATFDEGDYRERLYQRLVPTSRAISLQCMTCAGIFRIDTCSDGFGVL